MMCDYFSKTTILITISIVFFLGCSEKKTNKNSQNPVWINTIYDRIGTAPVGGGFRMDNYWVWGSSVIEEKGKYHMFVSRWSNHLTFHPGWMIASEIVHAVSDTPEGPYEFQSVALPSRGAQYWDGRSTHNPKITKYKDTYVLFYMGSTHPFEDFPESDTLKLKSKYSIIGRSNKRIGVAYSKSLNGPWARLDTPILDTKPETFYSFLTSNPAPWINEDGSVLLVFKSRKYKENFPFRSSMAIGVASAPNFMGPYKLLSDEPIFSLEKNAEVEDPCLWKDKDGYHILAKDQRGKITGEKGNGVLMHSKDGINWQLDDKPLAYSKNIKTSEGKTVKMGQLERCSVLLDKDGKVTHLFFATMDGPGGFNNSTKSWNMVLPMEE